MEAPWDIVCFAGVDWDSHRQRPHWLMQFVLVGPVRTRVSGLRSLENVLLTGERPHEIPGLLRAFDAGIIPNLQQGLPDGRRPMRSLPPTWGDLVDEMAEHHARALASGR